MPCGSCARQPKTGSLFVIFDTFLHRQKVLVLQKHCLRLVVVLNHLPYRVSLVWVTLDARNRLIPTCCTLGSRYGIETRFVFAIDPSMLFYAPSKQVLCLSAHSAFSSTNRDETGTLNEARSTTVQPQGVRRAPQSKPAVPELGCLRLHGLNE
jgi:hypothetical protein